uniref:Hp20 protein n=1 Tax=Halobacterium phage phiH TaxID=169684 RepID=Q38207_BPPHH|nr:hp20 [Halobacterium phage phiH]
MPRIQDETIEEGQDISAAGVIAETQIKGDTLVSLNIVGTAARRTPSTSVRPARMATGSKATRRTTRPTSMTRPTSGTSSGSDIATYASA